MGYDANANAAGLLDDAQADWYLAWKGEKERDLLAARALRRAAERCYVLSTGEPRPKRDVTGWAPLLAAMGLTLRPAEAAALDAALGAGGTLERALRERVLLALPGLLAVGALAGVRPFPPVRRKTPVPAAVLAEARAAVAAAGLSGGTLFGSWARGEERPGSDIDVLAVGEPPRIETHGRVQLHVMAEAELRDRVGVAAQGAARDGIPLGGEVPTAVAAPAAAPVAEPTPPRARDTFLPSLEQIREHKAKVAEAEQEAARRARAQLVEDDAQASRIQAAAAEFVAKAAELGLEPPHAGRWAPLGYFTIDPSGTPLVAYRDQPLDGAALRRSCDDYTSVQDQVGYLISAMTRLLQG